MGLSLSPTLLHLNKNREVGVYGKVRIECKIGKVCVCVCVCVCVLHLRISDKLIPNRGTVLPL